MTTATASANGIEIVYETFGQPDDPPVLLVAGLGAQLLMWDEGFCTRLAGRGHCVVRFDNRDAGLSTHLTDAPRPNAMAAMTGDVSSASYTLDDMADDTEALIGALGFDSMHVVGISMGGMIAQTLAIRHPARVRSLTSIMSTTGARDVGGMTPEGFDALLLPPVRSADEAVERTIQGWRLIGSKGFDSVEQEEERLRSLARRSFERHHDPLGVGRQLVAILASGDRTAALGEVAVPAAVIHGSHDPLISVTGGEATAKAIPGAELDIIEGMAHDLPLAVRDRMIDRIASVVRQGEQQG